MGSSGKKKQKLNKIKAPKRCCRRYCIGCPWTIAQLNGPKKKRNR